MMAVQKTTNLSMGGLGDDGATLVPNGRGAHPPARRSSEKKLYTATMFNMPSIRPSRPSLPARRAPCYEIPAKGHPAAIYYPPPPVNTEDDAVLLVGEYGHEFHSRWDVVSPHGPSLPTLQKPQKKQLIVRSRPIRIVEESDEALEVGEVEKMRNADNVEEVEPVRVYSSCAKKH